jgi:hypothetical protein
MDTITKFMVPGIVFLLTLASGFWLSHAGKPLNGIIFNIHKLIALGAVVATAVQLSKLLKAGQIQVLLIILIVVAALSVVALFVTGALMSLDKPAYETFLVIHQIAPVLVLLAMGATVYLLHTGYQLLVE